MVTYVATFVDSNLVELPFNTIFRVSQCLFRAFWLKLVSLVTVFAHECLYTFSELLIL